ncbi:acid-sensing ion channel 1A-like [Acanthaster planci]|uniref:Acid-sensing ion channel 1A-like n=1 Tax=Acanthaster planci TaxID=133434 RepID=A0A8B7Y4J8_ACAPL|nr:acid-sensing ion channel 1A-like [Acanthaster planci]
MTQESVCNPSVHASQEEPSLEYEFATTTTLHGVSRVAGSSGARAKTLWVLVLLIAGGFYVAITVIRIQAYLKFDANTNVIVKFNDALEFPAVTICNYNRFMNNKISEDDTKYVRHLLELNEDLVDYEEDFNYTHIDDLFGEGFNYTQFALTTGFTLNESMIRCDWKGVAYSCNALNFSSYYSPSYGHCYTFNTRGDQKSHEQSQQGIGNGLQLIVDIRQPEYTETFKSGHLEAGLKFAVHPRDELPLTDTMGLSAAPGFHTYASMRRVRHINLPEPWGVCGTGGVDKSRKYSRNTCLRNCRRNVIIAQCKCQPLGYERAVDLNTSEPVQLCDIDQFHCVTQALDIYRVSFSALDCTCPVACDYITYETTLSMAKYPSQSVIVDAIGAVQAQNWARPGAVDAAYLDENLVYLDVYFEELSTITYKQVEALSFTALVGDLGGLLGLFLGASVITGAELLDYVIRRLHLLILVKRPARKVLPNLFGRPNRR